MCLILHITKCCPKLKPTLKPIIRQVRFACYAQYNSHLCLHFILAYRLLTMHHIQMYNYFGSLRHLGKA